MLLISHRKIHTSEALVGSFTSYNSLLFPFRLPWMQLAVPFLLQRLKPDVAHFTNSIAPLFCPTPSVVTVHDMSLELFPSYHPWRRVLTRPLIRAVARKARAIITVSHSAKKNIGEILGIEDARIHVVHEAAAPPFRPVCDSVPLRRIAAYHSLPSSFVLSVGTLEPRKNLPRLIQAYSGLPEELQGRFPLVLAGTFGWGYREIRRLVAKVGLESRIHLLGYVPYQHLPVIYSLASVFVYPSLHEGFGLPVVEAMSCGAPCLISHASSLREVGGESVEYVDPGKIDSIREGLEGLLDNPDRRVELARKGVTRAGTFSWDRAAARTLEVYRIAAGSAQRQPSL